MAWTKYFKPVNSVLPQQTTANTGYSSTAMSKFSSWLPEFYQGPPNRLMRYMQYEQMDLDHEVAAALDTIADFSTHLSETTKTPFEIEYNQDFVDFQQRMAAETEGLTLDLETLSEGVRAALLDPVKGEYYIAELNDESVACLFTVREWSDWRNGEVIWIHSLYVTPEARRQGVFKKLYLYLRRLVEADDDLKGLRLYVHQDNRLAHSAYQSLGMDGDHYRLFEWMPED